MLEKEKESASMRAQCQQEVLAVKRAKSKQAAELAGRLKEQGQRLSDLGQAHSGLQAGFVDQLESLEAQAVKAKEEAHSQYHRCSRHLQALHIPSYDHAWCSVIHNSCYTIPLAAATRDFKLCSKPAHGRTSMGPASLGAERPWLDCDGLFGLLGECWIWRDGPMT